MCYSAAYVLGSVDPLRPGPWALAVGLVDSSVGAGSISTGGLGVVLVGCRWGKPVSMFGDAPVMSKQREKGTLCEHAVFPLATGV